MSVQTIIAPALEPIFLQDVKDFLRIDASDTSNDSTLAILINASRVWTENYTRRRWMFQTVRLTEDFFPGTYDQRFNTLAYSAAVASGINAFFAGVRFAFVLPYAPVNDVLDVKYVTQQSANDGSIEMQAVDPANYLVDIASNPARVAPVFGQFWPIAAIIQNAVQVDYTVGYGRAVTCGIASGAQAITGATFSLTDIGSTVSIPGAGPNGSSLNGLIASVDAETFAATVSVAASATVAAVSAIVGVPNQARLAIIALAALWYENRLGCSADAPSFIKSMLFPLRDLRL